MVAGLFDIGYWAAAAIQRNQILGRRTSEAERPSGPARVGVAIEVGVHQRQQHPPFTHTGC